MLISTKGHEYKKREIKEKKEKKRNRIVGKGQIIDKFPGRLK